MSAAEKRFVSVSGATFARLQAAARSRGVTMRALLDHAIGEIPAHPIDARRSRRRRPMVAHAAVRR